MATTHPSESVLVCNGCGERLYVTISETGPHTRACDWHSHREPDPVGWTKCKHQGHCYAKENDDA